VLGIRIRFGIFKGLPDPDTLVRGIVPDPAQDPDSSLSHFSIEQTYIMLANKILAKNYILRLKIICLWISYKKKFEIFFGILKITEVRSLIRIRIH
jgi:hypothetical protein